MSSSGTRIGTTIAGYRLEALLGRGGMSVVYRADQVRLGRTVALKLLAETLTHDPSFRERFERESRHAAEIDHPNIIPIFDAGEAEGQLFIAMKYVRGTDLRSIVQREGALGVGRTLLYLDQAANALDAAHDRSLIHRDVKPANILVEQPSERVYLSDFGIVKHTASPGMTRTGVFVGTVDYAAPEQIEGLAVDARTDVYALGCVLYECLAGRAPFGREGEVAVMHAHLSEAPPSLHEVRDDLPRALDRVVATAMAKAKEDRYRSCEELMDAVRLAVGDVRGTSASSRAVALSPNGARGGEAPPEASPVVPPTIADAPPPPPPPVDPGPRRPQGRTPAWLLVIGAALVGALIAGVVAALATRGSGNDKVQTIVVSRTSEVTRTVPSVRSGSGTQGSVTAGTDTTTTQSTGTTTGPAATTELGRVVPGEILKNCTVLDNPAPGATETARCRPPADAGGTFYPTNWTLSVFPSGKPLLQTYNQILKVHHLPANGGQCNGVSWGGAGAWLHGPGKPGGHRLCYFQGTQSVIVWTHEKLGQADHVDFLGMAAADELDHPELFSWWRFWHHRMGKLLPGQ